MTEVNEETYSETQKALTVVLARIIELVKEDKDFAEAFSQDLETLLDEVGCSDAFGADWQNDPRGDFRNGEWSLIDGKIEGLNINE